MPETNGVLEFETRHFTVSLDENLLRIDLKGSLKNEIEEALENKPILKETLGSILSLFAPLHVRLSDIESVNVDKAGTVKIELSHRRDILIPLEHEDAERLADKLNEFNPRAKKEKWERIINNRRVMLQERAKKHARGRHFPPSSYVAMPWYFPTEQVDNVPKLQPRRKKKRPIR
jgi:hypothetical protein